MATYTPTAATNPMLSKPRSKSAPIKLSQSNRDELVEIFNFRGGKQSCIALMDTGADGLWIARRIVNKLRIRIDASKITKAKVAGDGIITCLGKVKLKWKTVTGARMFNEVFNVFESDHTDVILGHEFLREHGVVTFNMAGLQPILAATKESKDQREERKRQEKIREQGEIAHEERKIKSDKKKSASKEQRTSSKR